MYDTEKRVELVKKRVHEKYRRKKRRVICRLSALCTALSAFLVGTVVALRTKRKIFSYKIQKPLLKRNLKKDA